MQKYEFGIHRIVSSRLYEFAKVLEVPVTYFFEGMPSDALSGRPMSGRARKGWGAPLIKRETLELVWAYYKIHNVRIRKTIFEMVKATGKASDSERLGGRKKQKDGKR